MNSKKPSIRAVGQRSIPSTFLFRPSIRSNGSNEDVEIKNPSEKCPKISLSDFLNKKLHKSSVLSGSVQDTGGFNILTEEGEAISVASGQQGCYKIT